MAVRAAGTGPIVATAEAFQPIVSTAPVRDPSTSTASVILLTPQPTGSRVGDGRAVARAASCTATTFHVGKLDVHARASSSANPSAGSSASTASNSSSSTSSSSSIAHEMLPIDRIRNELLTALRELAESYHNRLDSAGNLTEVFEKCLGGHFQEILNYHIRHSIISVDLFPRFDWEIIAFMHLTTGIFSTYSGVGTHALDAFRDSLQRFFRSKAEKELINMHVLDIVKMLRMHPLDRRCLDELGDGLDGYFEDWTDGSVNEARAAFIKSIHEGLLGHPDHDEVDSGVLYSRNPPNPPDDRYERARDLALGELNVMYEDLYLYLIAEIPTSPPLPGLPIENGSTLEQMYSQAEEEIKRIGQSIENETDRDARSQLYIRVGVLSQRIGELEARLNLTLHRARSLTLGEALLKRGAMLRALFPE